METKRKITINVEEDIRMHKQRLRNTNPQNDCTVF